MYLRFPTLAHFFLFHCSLHVVCALYYFNSIVACVLYISDSDEPLPASAFTTNGNRKSCKLVILFTEFCCQLGKPRMTHCI